MEMSKEEKKRGLGKKILMTVLLLAVAALLGGGLWLSNWVKTKPFMNFTETTVELGDTLTGEITDYVTLPDFLMEKSVLDISGVHTDKVGNYTATVTMPLTTCEYLIHVEDTTPPVLYPVDKELYFAAGESYDVHFFTEGATDLSGDVDIAFAGKKPGEMLAMEEAGAYSVILTATDASGNTSMLTKSYEVENPARFIGVKDNRIKLGTEYNPMDYFVVFDDKFGNLTADVVMDDGGFTTQEEGQYTLRFTVTNAHGISSRAEETLTVQKQDKAVELGLNSEEVKLLTERDYFGYEVLPEEDKDKATDLVEPTLVNMFADEPKSTTRWISVSGSGVIYGIDEHYLYIGTNHHVMDHINGRFLSMDVRFFDGKVMDNYPTQEENRLKDSDADIAMFKLPVEDIPADTLLKLKYAHYDPNLVMPEKGQNLIAYAKNWDGGKQDLIKNQVVKNWSDTNSEFQNFTKRFQGDYYLTSPQAKHGMSGTGVFDCRGNFMGQIAKSAWAGGFSGDMNLQPERLEKLYRQVLGQ